MISKDFALAGKATFTIDNGKGQHFTFRIKRGKPNPNFPTPGFFLDAMSGADNERSFIPVGKVQQTGELTRTRLSRYDEGHQVWKVAKFALQIIWRQRILPEGYQLRHSGNCGRCGRKLTHPDSLTTGIGPECANRIYRTSEPISTRPSIPAQQALYA